MLYVITDLNGNECDLIFVESEDEIAHLIAQGLAYPEDLSRQETDLLSAFEPFERKIRLNGNVQGEKVS